MAAPETGGLSTSMRALRTMVREYLPPGAKIYETELGMGYPAGSVVDSKLLRQQADDYIRGNIICLGDGADVDGLFYTADYSTDGFGLAFNLDLDKHKYGTDSISPKPVLMATATMTRILEGTQTLGRVTIVAPGVYVYAFRRGQSIVLAAWAYPKYTTINLNLNCPTATIVNMVGVAQPVVLNNGTLRLPLGPDPKYVMDLPLTASLNTSKYQSVSSTQSYSPVATPVRALQESWGGGPNHGH